MVVVAGTNIEMGCTIYYWMLIPAAIACLSEFDNIYVSVEFAHDMVSSLQNMSHLCILCDIGGLNMGLCI